MAVRDNIVGICDSNSQSTFDNVQDQLGVVQVVVAAVMQRDSPGRGLKPVRIGATTSVAGIGWVAGGAGQFPVVIGGKECLWKSQGRRWYRFVHNKALFHVRYNFRPARFICFALLLRVGVYVFVVPRNLILHHSVHRVHYKFFSALGHLRQRGQDFSTEWHLKKRSCMACWESHCLSTVIIYIQTALFILVLFIKSLHWVSPIMF